MTKTPCGWPAPRIGVTGTLLVSTTLTSSLIGGDDISERQRRRGSLRHRQSARGIGAVIVQQRAAHTENLAVGVERDLGVPVLIALLRRRDEMLAAVLDPFDRLVERDRGDRDRGLFGIEDELRPKAAADIGRGDAHRGLIASENVREQPGADQRRLGRAPQRQPAFDVGIGDRAAAFDRMRAAAVLLNRSLEDMRGCGEGRIDIAVRAGELGKQIGAGIGMRARRIRLERRMTIGNGGQRLIIDFDQRRSVLGKIRRVGDDDGDGLADIDGFVLGQDRPIALLLVGAVRQRDRRAGRWSRGVQYRPPSARRARRAPPALPLCRWRGSWHGRAGSGRTPHAACRSI